MTRDSREFSAALVLGALGGAAVALALKSGAGRAGRGRSRAWSDLVSGVDWREALDSLKAGVETRAGQGLGLVPGVGSPITSRVGSGSDSELGSGMEAVRKAAVLLRELGSRVASHRR